MWKKIPKYAIVVYTDGACSKGKGGWAASLQFSDTTMYISGNENDTTNNRMELLAVVRALELLTEDCVVKLFSDSKYVVEGIRVHMDKWVFRNWKTSAGAEVSNRDLWERIFDLSNRHLIFPHWVKGHNGNPGNEIVDSLATYIRKCPVDQAN